MSEPTLNPCAEPPGEKKRYDLIDPDVRLMLQVRDDEAGAYEQLVERYRDRLLRFLQHVAPSPELAEDLVQEVFLRVFRARKSYSPDARFSTWLYTIADNVAHNAQRVHSRRKEIQIAQDDAPGRSGNGIADLARDPSRLLPARKLDQVELSQMVRLAIQALSDRQRVALLLSKFENMSYTDVAAAMQLTPKAVKSLLARARENLREMLQPYVQRGTLPFGAPSPTGTDESGPQDAVPSGTPAPR